MLNIKTTWDLSILANDISLESLKALISEMKSDYETFVNKWKDNKEYLLDPQVLSTALKEFSELGEKYQYGGKLCYAIGLKYHLDKTNNEIKSLQNYADSEIEQIALTANFFVLNLGKISKEIQEVLLSSPNLSEYKNFLEQVFLQAKHMLSEDEEKILSLTSQASYSNWVQMVSTLLSKREEVVLNEQGEEVKLNFHAILSLTISKNDNVRNKAILACDQILNEVAQVAEYELNSVLRDKFVDDMLRKYSYSSESRLLSDEVTKPSVDALVQAVSSNFDITHRFYKLKCKILNMQSMEYQHRNVALGVLKNDYTHEQACDLVFDSINKVSPKIASYFTELLGAGNIDFFPAKGKSGGGFCSSIYKVPSYILLNFTGKMTDVKTLSHEFGHAYHAKLSSSQSYLNSDYSLSIAEMSSTFMETLTRDEIYKNLDSSQSFYARFAFMEEVVATVFRQIALFIFEEKLHALYKEKHFLSLKEIGDLFVECMSSYTGDSITFNEYSKNYWVHWSHIRNYFYVYSYAFGCLISAYLADKVSTNKTYLDKYEEILSYGSFYTPKQAFEKSLGINTDSKDFWNECVLAIEKEMTAIEKEAEKLFPN